MLSTTDLARVLAAEFGLPVAAHDLEPIDGGLDPDASVWCATDDRGRLWAVKWTRRDNRYGLRLARSLARQGVVGVPAPLDATDGRAWSDIDGGRLSVTEWIPSDDAFETGLDHDQWTALGRLLRLVHDHDLPADDLPADDLPADDRSAPGARRGIRRAGTHVRRRLEEIDALVAAHERCPEDAQLTRFVEAWPAARSRIAALRDAARRLKLDREPALRVSCHGDPHLGNVVLDDRGHPWLIDFDDAVEAPREVDLVLVELGVLFSMPIAAAERAAFRAGYGPVGVDDTRILRFGCVRAVEDLVETAHELLTGETVTPTDELHVLFQGILSPTGLAGLVESRLEI